MIKTPGAPADKYAALNPTDVVMDHVFMAAPPLSRTSGRATIRTL